MKKKVLSIIGVAAVGAAMVFNVSVGSQSGFLSELALANIEALANVETTAPTGGGSDNCKKIKFTCNCTLNGIYHSTRIKECETYFNPVCGSSCAVTNCPSGTTGCY